MELSGGSFKHGKSFRGLTQNQIEDEIKKLKKFNKDEVANVSLCILKHQETQLRCTENEIGNWIGSPGKVHIYSFQEFVSANNGPLLTYENFLTNPKIIELSKNLDMNSGLGQDYIRRELEIENSFTIILYFDDEPQFENNHPAVIAMKRPQGFCTILTAFSIQDWRHLVETYRISYKEDYKNYKMEKPPKEDDSDSDASVILLDEPDYLNDKDNWYIATFSSNNNFVRRGPNTNRDMKIFAKTGRILYLKLFILAFRNNVNRLLLDSVQDSISFWEQVNYRKARKSYIEFPGPYKDPSSKNALFSMYTVIPSTLKTSRALEKLKKVYESEKINLDALLELSSSCSPGGQDAALQRGNKKSKSSKSKRKGKDSGMESRRKLTNIDTCDISSSSSSQRSGPRSGPRPGPQRSGPRAGPRAGPQRSGPRAGPQRSGPQRPDRYRIGKLARQQIKPFVKSSLSHPRSKQSRKQRSVLRRLFQNADRNAEGAERLVRSSSSSKSKSRKSSLSPRSVKPARYRPGKIARQASITSRKKCISIQDFIEKCLEKLLHSSTNTRNNLKTEMYYVSVTFNTETKEKTMETRASCRRGPQEYKDGNYTYYPTECVPQGKGRSNEYPSFAREGQIYFDFKESPTLFKLYSFFPESRGPLSNIGVGFDYFEILPKFQNELREIQLFPKSQTGKNAIKAFKDAQNTKKPLDVSKLADTVEPYNGYYFYCKDDKNNHTLHLFYDVS